MKTFLLHIGKTGGTALKAMLDQHNARSSTDAIEVLPHSETLSAVVGRHPDARLVFFVRDPVQRVVSGFYSRKRKGQPRYDSPWSPDEAEAFSRFASIDRLGEALSSPDASLRHDAHGAMHAIQHIRRGYVHYLGSVETLEAASGSIAFIGSLHRFDEDVARLKTLLGIGKDLMPPIDDIGSHRNPRDANAALSPLARANLEAWLAEDYRLYAWCENWRRQMLQARTLS